MRRKTDRLYDLALKAALVFSVVVVGTVASIAIITLLDYIGVTG